MARNRKSGRPKDPEARWAEAKRICRLSADDVRKAKALGMDPLALVKNVPSPSQRWKLPVHLWVRELYAKRFPGRTPLDEEREERDRAVRRRRRDLDDVARGVARELGRLPAVERVLRIAPNARPPAPEGPEVELAVHVTDTSSLRDLRFARAKAVERFSKRKKVGVTHHEVDVILLDAATGHYAGRLCHFRRCPADEPECQVPLCGASPFLRQLEGVAFDPGSLREAKQLHPRDPPGSPEVPAVGS